MVRKLVAAGASAALLLATALPAFAWFDNVDVAKVENGSEAVANTGLNVQESNQKNIAWKGGTATGGSSGQSMTTGNASARSTAVVVANTHLGCGCDGDDSHLDIARVRNGSFAEANSGLNWQESNQKNIAWKGGTATGGSSGQSMTTGNARSKSSAWVVVNTHAF